MLFINFPKFLQDFCALIPTAGGHKNAGLAPVKWLNMQSCRLFNLPSGWIIILQKREKSRFRPAFGVCSTQNLVEIFNNQFFVLTQNYFEETRFLKIEQFTELSCMTLLASIQTSFFPIKYF